ncbi:MAG: hypothetical protein A3I00_03915 [Betaproteobacteria bacterium RIFCSPLOWO2_02_FULL_64_12]|nr:MAG: hypothetical protein A3I00_03915 [Betaproteobacteria bacterium RIFCSPLOWO2_02_FULL_64_12]
MDDATPASTPQAGRRGFRLSPLWLAVAILGLALAWHWYRNYEETNFLREELARRLRDSDAEAREARATAKLAQEAVREAQTRLAQLEAKVAESQSQQVALEALYQELSRSRDEWVFAEIEQILTIASQQLQLVGNVQAALVALQTADSRLARSDRPQFIPLRKVIARDIERLKATPSVDMVGLALKLDQVIAGVEALPLAHEVRLAGSSRAEADVADGFWSRLGTEVWGEIRQLVRVRSIERPQPPLLAPNQAFFLRENLKLRLLSARLALLARDQTTFREDIRAAQTWVQRYFDARAKSSAAALANLKQLSASGIAIEVPTIADSLNAVRNFKVSTRK